MTMEFTRIRQLLSTEMPKIIESFASEYQVCQGLILTEDDLKCLLFSKILEVLKDNELSRTQTSDQGGTYASPLHSETKLLNNDQKLSIRPDITIVDTSHISLAGDTHKSMIGRKGFSIFGSSIAAFALVRYKNSSQSLAV